MVPRAVFSVVMRLCFRHWNCETSEQPWGKIKVLMEIRRSIAASVGHHQKKLDFQVSFLFISYESIDDEIVVSN
jgi:hypothetical protein